MHAQGRFQNHRRAGVRLSLDSAEQRLAHTTTNHSPLLDGRSAPVDMPRGAAARRSHEDGVVGLLGSLASEESGQGHQPRRLPSRMASNLGRELGRTMSDCSRDANPRRPVGKSVTASCLQRTNSRRSIDAVKRTGSRRSLDAARTGSRRSSLDEGRTLAHSPSYRNRPSIDGAGSSSRRASYDCQDFSRSLSLRVSVDVGSDPHAASPLHASQTTAMSVNLQLALPEKPAQLDQISSSQLPSSRDRRSRETSERGNVSFRAGSDGGSVRGSPKLSLKLDEMEDPRQVSGNLFCKGLNAGGGAGHG